MSTEVRLNVEAFVEIIAYLEDLAGRRRGDREMFGEREASDAEDHVTYLIHAQPGGPSTPIVLNLAPPKKR